MVAEITVIAIIVAALAVLYGIALTGDHPILTKHLRGVNADRTESRPVGILMVGIGLGVGLYAIVVFEGSFGAPMGTVRWWMGVAVAIVAIILVGGSLLRSFVSR